MNEDFEDKLHRAIEETNIIRARRNNLFTFGTTVLPYIFTAESSINKGDTLVRKGSISTDKPSIIMPEQGASSFEGFESTREDERGLNLLFGRAFQVPAMSYKNAHSSLDIVAKPLSQVTDDIFEDMEKSGDSRSALLSGPEDLWHISLLLYAAEMTHRSAGANIREMLERKHFNLGE